jgi:hypothetical protein
MLRGLASLRRQLPRLATAGLPIRIGRLECSLRLFERRRAPARRARLDAMEGPEPIRLQSAGLIDAADRAPRVAHGEIVNRAATANLAKWGARSGRTWRQDMRQTPPGQIPMVLRSGQPRPWSSSLARVRPYGVAFPAPHAAAATREFREMRGDQPKTKR